MVVGMGKRGADGGAVRAKGAAAELSSCEPWGLGQRGKIEKQVVKAGEGYRDGERERET